MRVRLADSITPLNLVGKILESVSRGPHVFELHAVVARYFDVECLAGMPFQYSNDVYARPRQHKIYFGDKSYYRYDKTPDLDAMPPTQVLRVSSDVTL